MKLSPEKKKEILLQSFDVLKDDYSNSKSKLLDIIEKMFPIDTDTAVDMWKYLLRKNSHFIRDLYEGSSLVQGPPFGAIDKIGIGRISEIIINDDFLKLAVFNEYGGEYHWASHNIIFHYLKVNPAIANELLNLIYTNSSLSCSFFKYFENEILDMIEEDTRMREESVEVLLYWVNKIQDPLAKARINVTLLNLASEEGEEEDDNDEYDSDEDDE